MIEPTPGKLGVCRSEYEQALRSNGVIQLTYVGDPLRLSPEDRALLFGLVDTLKAYAKTPPPDVARVPLK